MVEKFRQILSQLTASHGDVGLFAILQMDELVDRWSVIISAPWINDDNRSRVFQEIDSLIGVSLSSSERSAIARISIYPRSEHLVEELKNYPVGTEIKDQKVNGNIIHRGHVIAANPAVA